MSTSISISKNIQAFIFGVVLAVCLGFASVVSAAPEGQSAAVVNINTASASELAEALNGVGERKAKAITAYREQHGPFQSAADLAKVKGIGESIVAKNAQNITVK